ncbi:MAG: class I SAM-dependent methyltransferase [Kiritimatiellae bacterium]|nr:class I SAM-dependent methyltransferase [Kiritimatiellia bacterium]
MTNSSPLVEKYFTTVFKEDILPSRTILLSAKSALRFVLNDLFKGIEIDGKAILDIGGGSGIQSCYAACMNAREVVCLEPEGDGGRNIATEKFKKLKDLLSLDQATLEPVTFQEFESVGRKFDVILLNKSINHLNEDACIKLLNDEDAINIYNSLFAKLSSLSNYGAKLIVCDCSRYNFFSLLGMRNPIAPTIEWHKHHSPEVWADMLSKHGFGNPDIRWLSISRLGLPGKLLTGNKAISYFLQSRFCLTMDKSS